LAGCAHKRIGPGQTCKPGREIFINSKDLTKSAEYSVLTRLISAIFRKSSNPSFILEELSSIHDPNGGYHRNGKFIHSFYSEVSDIIERFFLEIGVMEKEPKKVKAESVSIGSTAPPSQADIANANFTICPDCSDRSIKMENGCLTCVNPKCGYSKCDK